MSRRKSTRNNEYRISNDEFRRSEFDVRSSKFIMTCALMACALFCPASAYSKADSTKNNSTLQIYLPREITIEDDALKLGQVSIIRGNESLVARASEIALGRISVPGQEIIIDRPLILSRLACNQIPASRVTLTGAEKITVKQRQQIVTGAKFVELALNFLKKNPPERSVCQYKPIRIPTDLIVPGASRDIELSPRPAKGGTRSQAKVRVAVLANGKQIGSREVTFRLKYNCRTAVTLVNIPAGAVISSENIKIEKTLSNYPEPADWRPPYGLVARRQLPAKMVIRPDMVGPVRSAIIVKRNQNVVIRIDRPGLLITAIGKSMQKGRVGEYIKVRNVNSQRIIFAKVNEDGTVEPVL